jgi:hypothetical protein
MIVPCLLYPLAPEKQEYTHHRFHREMDQKKGGGK